ncbi:NUDIX domain-containing protein [Streptomyces roseolilacinus]|uniref:NUDIX domain-containing protein n=1 Tax=Streptomyces roseolilacinus TaxID=66904 RepID=UPI00380F9513
MVVRRSAGLLVFRTSGGRLEVLVAHMGGPYWAARDAGAWTVPKGEYEDDETALAAARREFTEELGLPVPDGEPVPLGEARQAGGKVVTAWAVEGDLDPALVVPGTFTMEWPRGSGVTRTFPEVDRVAWCAPEEAAERLVAGQRVFVERLAEHLRGRGAP